MGLWERSQFVTEWFLAIASYESLNLYVRLRSGALCRDHGAIDVIRDPHTAIYP
jgi:hypothetical protein